MHNYSRLNESIKKISKGVYESLKPVSVIFGTVVNDEPLEINIEQKLTLNKNQLILSRNVTDFKTKLGLTDDEDSAEDYYIFNSLKKGEHVILLRLEGGQKFLVIDRVGDIV